MGIAGSLAVYIIIWWLVLFMVLPVGAARKIERDGISKGHDAGAPAKPMMWRKLLATTVISLILFGLFYWAESSGAFDFRAAI